MIMSLNALRGEEWNQPYHIHNIIQVSGWWLCEHTIMSLPTTNVNITRVIYNQEPPPCWICNRIEKCTRYASYFVSIAGLRLHSIKQTPSTLKWKQFQIILSEKADKWYMFYTTWFRQDALHFERMPTSNDWRDIT